MTLTFVTLTFAKVFKIQAQLYSLQSEYTQENTPIFQKVVSYLAEKEDYLGFTWTNNGVIPFTVASSKYCADATNPPVGSQLSMTAWTLDYRKYSLRAGYVLCE